MQTGIYFQLFITTVFYSLQTSFNSVTIDLSDKCYLWGTPRRPFSSTRFSHDSERADLTLQVFYNIPHKHRMTMSLEIYDKYKKAEEAMQEKTDQAENFEKETQRSSCKFVIKDWIFEPRHFDVKYMKTR